MKQLIGVNDYKKLMNFEIKKSCAFCMLSNKECDVSHFSPSESVRDADEKPVTLTDEDHLEVVRALNSLNLLGNDHHNE